MANKLVIKNDPRIDLYRLNIVADADSDTFQRDNFKRHSIQIVNPNGVILKIFLSNDIGDVTDPKANMKWHQFGADITALTDLIDITVLFRFIRMERGATTNPVSAFMISADRAHT